MPRCTRSTTRSSATTCSSSKSSWTRTKPTVAEAGGMMYMDDGIEMETIFGDGSQQQARDSWAPCWGPASAC